MRHYVETLKLRGTKNRSGATFLRKASWNAITKIVNEAKATFRWNLLACNSA